MYRAAVARGIYLAQNRSDIGFAVKELARKMSTPDKGEIEAFKKLGKFLFGRTRYVVSFGYQEGYSNITTWADSDHA